MKIKRILTLYLILLYTISYSQNFLQKQLPTPENLSAFYFGPLLKSTIHYGQTPNNYNGNVLLFNHGYIDLNQLFFTNNTFYKDAYTEGYQVVFVATTRGKGMWENGALLAESIDIITNKFKVNQLSIIAHSNGGKATEVAMFSHHKKDKVEQVFTLGTPFWGTYLADISQQWWFNWIWDKTGLNEGSVTSTTYYCKNVVRPYFDNLSSNQPQKFISLAGSGFNRGHTILAPLMFTSGGILYPIQGTNDGVTSYNSSKRPGATNIFSKGEAKLDHIDLAFGQHVWQYIKPYLNGTLNSQKSTIQDLTPVQEISSDYQIINSENNYDNIRANQGRDTIILDVFHEKSAQVFSLKASNASITLQEHTDSRKKFTQYQSRYLFKNNSEKPVKLSGNSKFVAYMHFPEGPLMTYKKTAHFINIAFERTQAPQKEITVNVVINKTSDLYGNKSASYSHIEQLIFDSSTQSFRLNTTGYDDGIYSVYITGEHQSFTRSLVSGFTVGQLSSKRIDFDIIAPITEKPSLNLKSNVITDNLTFLNTSKLKINNLEASVYSINGTLFLRENISSQNGTFILKSTVTTLPKGLYIVIVKNKTIQQSFKFIKS